MRFLFSTVLLVSFVGIAIFGLVGMYHDNSQNHNSDCIWAASQSTDCPKQSNLIDYLTLHLNAFKDFATVLIFSLLAVGTVLGVLWGNLALPKLSPAYRRFRQSDSFHPPSQHKLTRWLSLHENSPSTS